MRSLIVDYKLSDEERAAKALVVQACNEQGLDFLDEVRKFRENNPALTFGQACIQLAEKFMI